MFIFFQEVEAGSVIVETRMGVSGGMTSWHMMATSFGGILIMRHNVPHIKIW